MIHTQSLILARKKFSFYLSSLFIAKFWYKLTNRGIAPTRDCTHFLKSVLYLFVWIKLTFFIEYIRRFKKLTHPRWPRIKCKENRFKSRVGAIPLESNYLYEGSQYKGQCVKSHLLNQSQKLAWKLDFPEYLKDYFDKKYYVWVEKFCLYKCTTNWIFFQFFHPS